MKKLWGICLAVLSLGFLSSCATKFPETDTIYIQKNGSVKEATVKQFDKTYYEEEELKSFIEDALEDYKGGGVRMEKLLVEDKTAKLMMKYDNFQSYVDFDGRELFVGTVVQALANGYNFSGAFLKVENGKTSAGAGDTESTEIPSEAIGGDIVSAEEEDKVVVLNEDTDVVVRGSICYVSAEGVTVKDKNTASVKKRNDGVSYIVYK